MAARRGGLGKGLDSLISPGHLGQSRSKRETGKTGGQSSREGC